MENFNIFIEEIQKFEIRVKEFYIDNDYAIEDFTVDEAPDYLFKKGFFLDLSHYNNNSSYSEKLKILQQRALTELSNLSIEQVNIHLSRIGLILSRFSKMYDKCNAVKEKFEKGNFNKVDLELEIFSAFIVEKAQNYNLASVTESFFWDLLDAITVQKDGYLQGFDKQIRDIFNIPKEEPKIKHLPLNIEHELSQKPTITARLDYWREIKNDLTKDEFIQIYDKYIRNDLLTPDGRIWDLVSKAKDYVIHFIRSISWKLNSEFAINIIRSEIKAMEVIENEVKQLFDTGVTMEKIEEHYKDFKKEYETRKYNLNGEVVQKTKEEFDILKRKEELTEVMRVKTNHYRANIFNDYSVMIYSKYKFYKPYLEAKLKELEQPASDTSKLESISFVPKQPDAMETNVFCEKMPFNIPIEHFKILTEKSNKNNEQFLTQKQFDDFIERAFKGNTKIPSQKFNFSSRENLKIQYLFYDFFVKTSFDYFGSIQFKEKYVKLLTENFIGWEYKNVSNNFNKKPKKILKNQ